MALRVLVADDEPVALKLAAEIVRREAHVVLEAGSGTEAWDAVRAFRPELVLCDWELGDLDGIELCRRLRERSVDGHVYFILVSASRYGRSAFETAMQAGVDDFLQKPLDPETVRLRLAHAERLLGLMKQVSELEGLIPVCAYCRRVRNSGDAYERMEAYLERHSRARFTHGICPDCQKKQEGGAA